MLISCSVTAVYGNEEFVGTAIRESGLDRSELYITTKYDGGDIQESIRSSLDKVCLCSPFLIMIRVVTIVPQLDVKSVDLYLIHFPRFVEHDFEGTWREIETIKEAGLAKYVKCTRCSAFGRILKSAI